MTSYYSTKLGGERLMAMYDAAPQRIKQYLRAEIEHVRSFMTADCLALELGCGYGRVLQEIASLSRLAVGIDTSFDSLRLGRQLHSPREGHQLFQMDATQLAFADGSFDLVLCIQNGVSAFHVDKTTLFVEALRVAKPSGTVVFSTYAKAFWDERLKWFEEQARDGFIGPINYECTGDGRIVCADGFTASTVSTKEFHRLAIQIGVDAAIYEIDDSSLFCEIRKQV